MNHALAVFVKTPGLSPVKTRLAKEIGNENAHHFYSASVQALSRRLEQFQSQMEGPHSLTLYWSVAELEGLEDSRWSNWPRIYQGEGSLSERIATTYSELLRAHDTVTLLGADCPHLSLEVLRSALHSSDDFSVALARDGGFYLLTGTKPLTKEFWTSLPMSSERTGELLKTALRKHFTLRELPINFDIDQVADLIELKKVAANAPDEFPELITFFRSVNIPESTLL